MGREGKGREGKGRGVCVDDIGREAVLSLMWIGWDGMGWCKGVLAI